MTTKILGYVWFSSLKGQVGIVAINNGHENKAYIAPVDGWSELADVDTVVNYGGPFPYEQAKALIGGIE